MGTKEAFVKRQHDEVRATLEALKGHRDTATERLKQEPDDDELRDLVVDTEEGIGILEPVLADFEREGVDPEELVKYAQVIQDWQEREAEIAKKFER